MAAERWVLPSPGAPKSSRLALFPGAKCSAKRRQTRFVRSMFSRSEMPGLRPLGVGVPVQGKALKALIAQVQEPGELLLLLPGIVLPQAAADLAVLPVAPVLAEGAEGLLLQGVLGEAHGAEQAGALLLQAQVLVPQDLDGPGGVRAPGPGRSG